MNKLRVGSYVKVVKVLCLNVQAQYIIREVINVKNIDVSLGVKGL